MSRTLSVERQRQVLIEHQGHRNRLQATVSAKVHHAGRESRVLDLATADASEVEAGGTRRQGQERSSQKFVMRASVVEMSLLLELQPFLHRHLLVGQYQAHRLT